MSTGTASVAGIIAADATNGLAHRLAPDSPLLNVKVADDDGRCGFRPRRGLICAVDRRLVINVIR
jgi:hypothetical protein